MSESSTYSISKYFFKGPGDIEIPPPGAIINGRLVTGLRRPAAPFRDPRKRPEQVLRESPTPLRAESHNKNEEQKGDDDDEVEAVELIPKRTRPVEIEDLDDNDDDDDDDVDDEETQPIPQGKKFFFVESRKEFSFICTPTRKRPNETLLYKDKWTLEDIQSFLGTETGIGFNQEEINAIINLSKQAQRLKNKLQAEFESFQAGMIDANEFRLSNFFDYRALRETLEKLYEAEQRPRQHVVMFLIPGSKPRYIASDLPWFLPIQAKQHAFHTLFMPKARSIKRILYWVQPTSNIREPLTSFGTLQPVDVMTLDPHIQRSDEIITAFMGRDWKLERLFTLPEFW